MPGDHRPMDDWVEEKTAPRFSHDAACACPDCALSREENGMPAEGPDTAAQRELAQLREEVRSLKKGLLDAQQQRDRWRARFQALPQAEREYNTYEIHPRCPGCSEKIRYFVGFRGRIIGRLFAGPDNLRVTDEVVTQGEADLMKGLEIPDRFPEDMGDLAEGA